MSEKIDHKNEAIDRVEGTFFGGATDQQRANGIAKAQVHATLYLAEQQRIANLIALGYGVVSRRMPNDLGEEGTRKAVKVDATIREGLGV